MTNRIQIVLRKSLTSIYTEINQRHSMCLSYHDNKRGKKRTGNT